MLHNKYDLEDGSFFQSPSDARTRGHSHKVFKERAVSSARRNFFSCRVTELWNELPESVVTAPSIDSFKQRLDDFRLDDNRDWLYDFESTD